MPFHPLAVDSAPRRRSKSDFAPVNPPVPSNAPKRTLPLLPITEAFIDHAAAHPELTWKQVAKAVGYKYPSDCRLFFEKYRVEIEESRVRQGIVKGMETQEQLRRLAVLARQDGDLKVALAATRSLLEVDGLLGRQNFSGDRGVLARELAEMVSGLQKKLGGKTRRARVAVAVEVENDEKQSVSVKKQVAEAEPKQISEGGLGGEKGPVIGEIVKK